MAKDNGDLLHFSGSLHPRKISSPHKISHKVFHFISRHKSKDKPNCNNTLTRNIFVVNGDFFLSPAVWRVGLRPLCGFVRSEFVSLFCYVTWEERELTCKPEKTSAANLDKLYQQTIPLVHHQEMQTFLIEPTFKTLQNSPSVSTPSSTYRVDSCITDCLMNYE